MPGTTTKNQKETTAKPPFDPYEVLGHLKGVVEKNTRPTKDGGKSWLGILVIISVVLVGVAVWSWVSWRRNRELARLRHEKNKTKILKERQATLSQIARNDQEAARIRQRLVEAEDKLQAVEADIRAEEARYEADMRAIDAIRSWRDAGIR